MSKPKNTSSSQRNALLPSLIAVAALIVGIAFVGTSWFTIILFLVSIFALIVAWLAAQARHWWWVPVFVAIAVLWNPAYPFPFSGIFWMLAQPLAGNLFLIAGFFIKHPRDSATKN